MSLRHHVRVWTNEPLGTNVRFGAKKRERPPDQFYFRLGARRRHGQQGSSFDKACGDYVLPLRPRRTNRAISLTSCSLAPPRATTFMPDFRVNSMRPTVSALRSRLNSPDSIPRRTWSANAATTARPARSFKALISRSDRPNSAIDPISLGQNRPGSS